MAGVHIGENVILDLENAFFVLDIYKGYRHTCLMVTPDPRPNVDARDAKLSPQPEAPPTALEALRIYISKWSKHDASLKQYCNE